MFVKASVCNLILFKYHVIVYLFIPSPKNKDKQQ